MSLQWTLTKWGGKKTRRMQEKEVKKRTQKGEGVLKEMAIKRKKRVVGEKREKFGMKNSGPEE